MIATKRYCWLGDTGSVELYQRLDDSWVVEVYECGNLRIVFEGCEEEARQVYAVQRQRIY